VSEAGLAVALLVLSSGPAGGAWQGAPAAPIRCEYTSRIECTSAGCAAAKVDGYLRLPPASVLLDRTVRATSGSALPTIEICTSAGCTPIAVRAARSGIFLNVAQDGGAHFVKIAMADSGARTGIRTGDFVEVAAQFLSTVTHVGRCPAVVD
jgi:hypothetical protein